MNQSQTKYEDFQGDGNAFDYNPHPVDMTNLTLNREMQNMAERLAENSHDIWAKKKREEIDTCGGAIHSQLVPYDLLTDKEKRKDRERSQEFLKYMQYQGLKLHKCVKPNYILGVDETNTDNKIKWFFVTGHHVVM